MNRALTKSDLTELERILTDSGIGGSDELAQAKSKANGLGLFVRSLVGLDRQAAKEAMAGFLSGKNFGANQIEFVDLIVDYLTDHGVMDAALLYEAPFTELSARGPEALFTPTQMNELVAILRQVQENARAA